MLKLHLLNRFRAYKSGKELIGIAGEINLPEITNMTDTLEGGCVGGTMDMPVIGLIENMEIEIAFLSLCTDIFSIMDPTESDSITFNGAIQGMEAGTGKIGFVDLSITIKGTVKKFVSGNLKAGSKMGSSVTLNLSYYKLVLDGKTELEIDRLNDVFIVNGKDILKDVKGMC